MKTFLSFSQLFLQLYRFIWYWKTKLDDWNKKLHRMMHQLFYSNPLYTAGHTSCWLIEWCFTPLLIVFQLYQVDSSRCSGLSWASPVLSRGSEVSCPRTLPWKTQRIQSYQLYVDRGFSTHNVQSDRLIIKSASINMFSDVATKSALIGIVITIFDQIW